MSKSVDVEVGRGCSRKPLGAKRKGLRVLYSILSSFNRVTTLFVFQPTSHAPTRRDAFGRLLTSTNQALPSSSLVFVAADCRLHRALLR